MAAGAVEHLLDLVEDVPYGVAAFGAPLLGSAVQRRPGRPGRFDERVCRTRAFARIALEEDPAYTQLWMSLTEVQKKALKAVIASGGRLLLSQAVTTEHSLSVASMQKALKALNDRGIIREEQSLGDARLRLDDPFFATWLKAAQAT